MIGYPLDKLSEEVAYIAYYFHWPHEQIMNLEHLERERWTHEISKINQRLNNEVEAGVTYDGRTE